MKKQNLLLIGICGGSASGKSSIAKYIQNYFNKEECEIIELDSYYYDLSHLSLKEREKNNFDHPKAFDFDFMYNQLKELKKNNSISSPIYNYKKHIRENKFKNLSPKKIILIEGILIFYDKKILDLLDMKIFIDTSQELRLQRRIKRDLKGRERTYDSIINQMKSTVIPMHNKFIRPTKKYADFIITKGVKNTVALEQVISNIISMINNKN